MTSLSCINYKGDDTRVTISEDAIMVFIFLQKGQLITDTKYAQKLYLGHIEIPSINLHECLQ